MNKLKNHILSTLKSKIYLILSVALWLPFAPSMAQQALQFSQYFSNQLVLNPAYAGADNSLSLTAVHRNQWSGVTGAPKTSTLSGHTLFKNARTGLGAILLLDEINIHSSLSFTGVYSYRININANSYINLGLQAGFNHVKSDYASLTGGLQNPNDPNILSQEVAGTAFQFGTGIYYRNPRLEVGLSSPILYSSGFKGENVNNDSTAQSNLSPYVFLFTRYKIDLSHRVQLHPGFLLKSKPDWPLSVDLNMDVLINEVLMFGVSYRSFETISTIVQIKVLPQMKIGYSYDIPLSNMQRRDFNSHEIMLNYRFYYKDYKVKSPR